MVYVYPLGLLPALTALGHAPPSNTERVHLNRRPGLETGYRGSAAPQLHELQAVARQGGGSNVQTPHG